MPCLKKSRNIVVLLAFLLLSASLTFSAFAANTRFVTLDDGTVQDTKTGLIWASSDNGANISWTAAKAYCKTYSEGGFSDWRMPAPSEIQSLYGNKKKVKGKDYAQSIDIATDAINLSAPYVWTSRKMSGAKAVAFGFNYGVNRRLKRGTGGNRRALPVRSPSAQKK